MIQTLSNETAKKSFFKKVVFGFWGYVIPLIVVFVVCMRLLKSSEALDLIYFPLQNWQYLILAILLLPLNVLLESAKWYVMVKKSLQLNLGKCAKIVLAGKSLNLLSPLGLGDAFVKYMKFHPGNRNQSVGLILLDRMANMLPTLMFGLVSTLFLIKHGVSYLTDVIHVTMVLTLGMVVLGLLLYFLVKRYMRSILEIGAALRQLGFKEILGVMSLAFFRYFVFSAQFYFILIWAGVELDVNILMMGVFWIFFVKTIIPDFTIFGDLMKRELSAITFFSLFLPSMELVFLANFWIWTINIILPALSGIVFVRDLKNQTL